eukprot:scaffold4126_cov383-Prasinococcus_capsulatus_cf.AAC.4
MSTGREAARVRLRHHILPRPAPFGLGRCAAPIGSGARGGWWPPTCARRSACGLAARRGNQRRVAQQLARPPSRAACQSARATGRRSSRGKARMLLLLLRASSVAAERPPWRHSRAPPTSRRGSTSAAAGERGQPDAGGLTDRVDGVVVRGGPTTRVGEAEVQQPRGDAGQRKRHAPRRTSAGGLASSSEATLFCERWVAVDSAESLIENLEVDGQDSDSQALSFVSVQTPKEPQRQHLRVKQLLSAAEGKASSKEEAEKESQQALAAPSNSTWLIGDAMRSVNTFVQEKVGQLFSFYSKDKADTGGAAQTADGGTGEVAAATTKGPSEPDAEEGETVLFMRDIILILVLGSRVSAISLCNCAVALFIGCAWYEQRLALPTLSWGLTFSRGGLPGAPLAHGGPAARRAHVQLRALQDCAHERHSGAGAHRTHSVDDLVCNGPCYSPRLLGCTALLTFAVVAAAVATQVGFLKMFTGLAKGRFEHLISSPTPNRVAHLRTVTLLSSLLVLDGLWGYVCLSIFSSAGLSEMFLLMFEIVVVAIDIVQALSKCRRSLPGSLACHSADSGMGDSLLRLAVRYAVHMLELYQQQQQLRAISRGIPESEVFKWEGRGTFLYHLDFVTELCILTFTWFHYCQVFWLHGVGFQLTDAILVLHIKALTGSIFRKIRTYCRYRAATRSLQNTLPDATPEELERYEDECAICKEPMSHGKKLSCGHIFHLTCLRQWLEQSTSESYKCPMCRAPLVSTHSHECQHESHRSVPANDSGAGPENGNDGRMRWEQLLRQRFQRNLGANNQPQGRHPSAYQLERNLSGLGINFLASYTAARNPNPTSPSSTANTNRNTARNDPSISHTSSLPEGPVTRRRTWWHRLSEDDLHRMVLEVQEVLPYMSSTEIMRDLTRTRSPTITINNLLN